MPRTPAVRGVAVGDPAAAGIPAARRRHMTAEPIDEGTLPDMAPRRGRPPGRPAVELPEGETARDARKKNGKGGSGAVTMMPRRGRVSGPIEVPPLEEEEVEVQIWGRTPLIVNNFGMKARAMILAKQTKEAKLAREAKVPFDDFMGSLYAIPGAKIKGKKLKSWESWGSMKDTFGFPASGFKKSMVSACSFVSGIPKTILRGSIHIIGDLVPISFKKLVMREDVVRVGPFGRRVADIRFRGMFENWTVTLKVSYNTRLLSIEQIVNLLEHAGNAIGVGEWRPEKDGQFGMFTCRKRGK
jgi:hypothetical protein